jgi:hypothetical protein
VGASSIEVSLTTVDGEIEASPERDQILEAVGPSSSGERGGVIP